MRSGESETSEYRPAHKVFSYKYIKFCNNGKAVSIYTIHPPKKFVKKLGGRAADMMDLTMHGDPKKKGKFTQPAL